MAETSNGLHLFNCLGTLLKCFALLPPATVENVTPIYEQHTGSQGKSQLMKN